MKIGEKRDACDGCSARLPSGEYPWTCMECRRWWPDHYRRDDCPARAGCASWPSCAGCPYKDDDVDGE